MNTPEDSARFERIDWDEIDQSRRISTPDRVSLCVGLLALLALYVYDTAFSGIYLVGTWQVDRLDWVVLVGLVVIGSFVGVPAVRHRQTTRRVLERLLARPAHAGAFCLLVIFTIAGFLGPAILGSPTLEFAHRLHAPLGFSGQQSWTVECLGAVTLGEDMFTRYCEGSLTYPIGTNHRGHALGHLLVTGARVALYVVVFTAAFVVPLAAAVGVIAGFRGGLVDDLLMSYVDVQLCIPAILVYFIGYMYWNVSLLLLLVTFGLLSWGGIARLVRSEVLQRREDGHVLVARSLGASPTYVATRHILPNVTNTLVPAIFHLLALLVLVEAGVAYLDFHHIEMYSWGSTIQEGLDPPFSGIGLQMDPHEIWWISTFPALALSLMLVSLKLVGDGLRDALDPRRTLKR